MYECASWIVCVEESGGSMVASREKLSFCVPMRACWSGRGGTSRALRRKGKSGVHSVVVKPPGFSSPCKPYRPALPAICLTWETERYRSVVPSHLLTASNMIRLIFLHGGDG